MSLGGFDWTSYLQSLEEQNAQSQGGSFFPSTAASNLSSLARLFGAIRAGGLSRKQQQLNSMLAQARQFGIAGIRKLYDDSTFQQLAKETGVALAPLPPLTSAEIEENRRQAFLTAAEKEIGAGRKGPVPGGPFSNTPGQPSAIGVGSPEAGLGTRPLSPSEIRGVYSKEAVTYPEAASQLGIVPRVSPGALTTLLRGILDYRMNPSQVLAGIDLLLSETGQDPSNITPELRQEIGQLSVGPYAQAQLDNLRSSAVQKIAASQLSAARKADLESTLNTRLQEGQARIQALLQSGNYREALSEVAKINAQWLPRLNQLKVDVGTSQIARNEEYTKFLRAHADLYASQQTLENIKIKYSTVGYGQGIAGLKLREQTLRDLMNATLKNIGLLNNRIVNDTSLSDSDKSTLQDEVEKERSDLHQYTKDLYDISNMEQVTGPKGQSGLSQLDLSTINPLVISAYNATVLNVKDVNQFPAMFAKWKKNSKLKDLTPQDWNNLWILLRIRAGEMGVNIQEQAP